MAYGMVIGEIPIEIAAKPQGTSAELDADSKRTTVGPPARALSILRSWSINSVEPYFSFYALDYPQELTIGKHVLLLIGGVVHRHAVEQAQLSRFGLEFSFEDVGARKVSSRRGVLARRSNSPETAFFYIQNGCKK